MRTMCATAIKGTLAQIAHNVRAGFPLCPLLADVAAKLCEVHFLCVPRCALAALRDVSLHRHLFICSYLQITCWSCWVLIVAWVS